VLSAIMLFLGEALNATTMIGGAVSFGLAWWWLVQRKHHDDDDEVYTAFFNANASPVATPHAFLKILARVPAGGRVLDVGVGSGVYLEYDKVRELIRERKLIVDGVDISAPNVAICQDRIKKHGLGANFSAICQDVRTLEGATGKYDAILFMESFPVMSKELFLDIFRKVQPFAKPRTGINYLYHNLGDRKKLGALGVAFGRISKPTMKLFLGIDFGRLTTQDEMDELVRRGAPDAPPYEDEILLSAEFSETRIDLSGVSNWWFWLCGKVTMAVMRLAGPTMEQHLITIRA